VLPWLDGGDAGNACLILSTLATSSSRRSSRARHAIETGVEEGGVWMGLTKDHAVVAGAPVGAGDREGRETRRLT